MKNIMSESSKVIQETSDSLEQTLRNENAESGKPVSSLKETLGMAQELAKTLSEGRTHQHTQVPSIPPSKPQPAPEPIPEPKPSTSDTSDTATIETRIICLETNLDRSDYYSVVDMTTGLLQIKTKIDDHNITLTYHEKTKQWVMRRIHLSQSVI